ncbi:alpha/beta hydrolase [Amycolatopsis sp. CA-128772]|uniref:alpha/beta hydrolase n=1 Tax=Amycolatopsis sp. CA-128772 TaxID=2073159 RepID=UPI000CD214BD|nr:alpha/beta hydrolase [Amycolatopsis sp. CA-128772]
MVTWGDAVRWNPAVLQDAVGAINAAYNKLVACSDDLRDINTPEGWHGDAAAAAAGEVNQIIDGLEEYAADIAALRRAAGDSGDAITGVQNGVKEAEAIAAANHFTIAGNGAVVDNGAPEVPEAQRELADEERRRVAEELKDRVEEVVRQAINVDEELCSVLNLIQAGQVIDATANDNEHTSLAAAGNAGAAIAFPSIMPPPAVDADPSMNAAWWAALSVKERQQLIAQHPDWVGNRDGVKASDRSKANLNLLDQEKRSFAAELDRLKRDDGDSDEIARLEQRLEALDAITGMMHNPDGTINPNRQLMSLDMTGDHPKAAIANGDVDTAQHVAVFTPGMNSTVDGNMNGYVNDMQGVRHSAEDMLRRAGDMSNVATVTWIGYEPSSFDDNGSLLGLATGENADVGGDKLAKFDQGVNASRTTDPHFTALGHSQGSIVTGISLTHGGTGVDDAVVFGSPGVSDHFGIDNTAADLKVPQGHAYNITAAGDPVAQWVPETWRYGAAPYAMDGMTQLSADAAAGPDGAPLAASHGHSEYTRTTPEGVDSTSKHNIAAIVAGKPQLTVPAH